MEKQKKQNLLTAVIIILVIALAIMITSIIYEEKVNMSKKPVQNVSAPVIEDDKTDADKNGDSSSAKENENKQPTETEQDKNNNTSQTGEVGEEENKTQRNTEKSKEEKAIELVKKQWGIDDSVTFSIEQKSGTKYYVAVKSDTKPTVWYEVDTESWKVSEY